MCYLTLLSEAELTKLPLEKRASEGRVVDSVAVPSTSFRDPEVKLFPGESSMTLSSFGALENSAFLV